MVQVLMAKGQEQEEDWGVVWAGWEEADLGRVPVGIVFAPVVEQKFLTRQVLPATS